MSCRTSSAIRRLLSFAAVLGSALGSRPTLAEPHVSPGPVQLSWVRGPGAEGCATQPRIQDRVAARFARSPFSERAERTIEAYVQRAPVGLRAQILIRSGGGDLVGSRDLTSNAGDCSSLEAASVLAIALAIDPEQAAWATTPGPTTETPPTSGAEAPVAPAVQQPMPAAEPAPADSSSGCTKPKPPESTSGCTEPKPHEPTSDCTEPKPHEPTSDCTEPKPPESTSGCTEPKPRESTAPAVQSAQVDAVRAPRAQGFAAALEAGFAWGLLPKSSPAGMLHVRASLSHGWELAAESLWSPEQRTRDARIGFGLAAFGLGACHRIWTRVPFDAAVCGSVWGGALHAVVHDLAPTNPGDYPWVAAAATLRSRVVIVNGICADLGAHLFVPAVRRPFMILGEAEPAFQQAAVAFMPFVGAGLCSP